MLWWGWGAGGGSRGAVGFVSGVLCSSEELHSCSFVGGWSSSLCLLYCSHPATSPRRALPLRSAHREAIGMRHLGGRILGKKGAGSECGVQSWISNFHAWKFLSPMILRLVSMSNGCRSYLFGPTHWTHFSESAPPPQRRWPVLYLQNVWSTVELKSAAPTMLTQCWWWNWCPMVRKHPRSDDWMEKMWRSEIDGWMNDGEREVLISEQYSAVGLPQQISGKESACSADATSLPWVGAIPWRRK